MTNRFGTQAPATTGKLYLKELKFPPNKTVKVVFVEPIKDSLQVLVHGENVLHDGRWKYVVSGSKNTHLFPAVQDPFDSHPDEKVAKLKWLRIALVYVVKGSEKLDGQYAYVHLPKSVFDALVSWEANMSEDQSLPTTVAGKQVAINRVGSGLNDTVYTATVIGEYPNFTVDDNEVSEIVDYLKGLYYVSGITTPELQVMFDNHITSSQYRAGAVNNPRNVVEQEAKLTPVAADSETPDW